MDSTVIIIVIFFVILCSSSSSVGGYFIYTSQNPSQNSSQKPSEQKSPDQNPSTQKTPVNKKEEVKKCYTSVSDENTCISSWDCNLNNSKIGNVNIWWGHTQGAGEWACNSWIKECNNKCTGAYRDMGG